MVNQTIIPTAVAANPPNNICPGVPILNNPVLNAKATDKPVSIKGVAVANSITNSLDIH